MNKVLDNLKERMSRKPNLFKDVITFNSLTSEEGEIIYNLEVYNTDMLGIKEPNDKFNYEYLKDIFGDMGEEEWFILYKGWGNTMRSYLICTGGYDYCRYVARIR